MRFDTAVYPHIVTLRFKDELAAEWMLGQLSDGLGEEHFDIDKPLTSQDEIYFVEVFDFQGREVKAGYKRRQPPPEMADDDAMDDEGWIFGEV